MLCLRWRRSTTWAGCPSSVTPAARERHSGSSSSSSGSRSGGELVYNFTLLNWWNRQLRSQLYLPLLKKKYLQGVTKRLPCELTPYVRQISHPSQPYLDQGRPHCEGFGYLSTKAYIGMDEEGVGVGLKLWTIFKLLLNFLCTRPLILFLCNKMSWLLCQDCGVL